MAYTLSEQHRRQVYTWTSPNGQYQNQIDYILCSQRWRSCMHSAKTRPGTDCGSALQLLIENFRLELKKVGKTTRRARCGWNPIPYEYAVEVTHRFKGWDAVNSAPEELCMEVHNTLHFSSVAQSCPTRCNRLNCSMPHFPVHHQLPESTQTHFHCVSDAIQSSHPLSSPSPAVLNLSQHQGLFKWVSSLHQVAEVLEFQLQHQSLQCTPRTDLL